MDFNYKEIAKSAAAVLITFITIILVTNIIPPKHSFLIFLFLLLAAFACGSIFGPDIAGLIMALYILANVLGYARFMDGQVGMSSFSSPLGGYKLGFLLVAYMTGILIPPGKDYSLGTLLLTFLGTGSLLHFVGVPWLASHSNMPPATVLANYFVPLMLPHLLATALILATYKYINKLSLS